MKRFLFFAAFATMFVASCQKTDVVYNEDPQEISFFAVNKMATKTPVVDAVFLDGDNMSVAAYIVEGAANPGNFFGKTPFAKGSGETWVGNPSRYWPITASTVNFFAVTEMGGGVDKTEVTFDATTPASKATAVLSGNAVTNQNDLMFAAGQGKCAPGSYDPVPMVFKHALSWIYFNVKKNANNCTIKVNSITLNEAVFDGTLTLTNTKYNSAGTDVLTENVNAEWTTLGTAVDAQYVPNAAGDAAAAAVTLTESYLAFGNGLLVVPNGKAESFTINYTLTQQDGTANTYDYTHTLTDAQKTWEMAKKYTYNISINLTEIEIAPEVDTWTDEPGFNVPLG